MTDTLMERICEPKNLNRAYRRVKANRGDRGVDGMTVGELRAWLVARPDEFIASLLDGSYRPHEVRGIEIPKPGGGCDDCHRCEGGQEYRQPRRPLRPPVGQGKIADADRPGASNIAGDRRRRQALGSGSGLARESVWSELSIVRIVQSVIEGVW